MKITKDKPLDRWLTPHGISPPRLSTYRVPLGVFEEVFEAVDVAVGITATNANDRPSPSTEPDSFVPTTPIFSDSDGRIGTSRAGETSVAERVIPMKFTSITVNNSFQKCILPNSK